MGRAGRVVAAVAVLVGAAAVAPPVAAVGHVVELRAPQDFYVLAPGQGPGYDDQYLPVSLAGRPSAHGVVVRIDARRLTGTVRLTPGAEPCIGTTELTCRIGTVSGPLSLQGLALSAAPGARPGDVADLWVRATATDAPTVVARVRVHVGRPELEVNTMPARRAVTPGSTIAVPVAVRAAGDVAAGRGFGVLLDAGNDAGLVPRHRNCHYQRTGTVVSSGYCTFPGPLRPGAARRLADDVRVVAGRRLLYGTVTATAWALGGPGPFDDFRPGDFDVRGRGPAVRLEPATGLRFGAGGGFLRLTSTGRADLSVHAGGVRGRTGDVVRVEVVVHNRGPADLDLSGREGATYRLTFRPPPGTTVLRNPFPGEDDPWTCSPARRGADLYRCPAYGETLAAGDSETFVFDLRLDRPVSDATGTAALDPNVPPWPARDAVPADDTATVRVDVVAVRAASSYRGWWTGGGLVLAATVAAGWWRRRRRRARRL